MEPKADGISMDLEVQTFPHRLMTQARYQRWTTIGLMVTTLISALTLTAFADETLEEKVRALVERFGDDDWQVRENASKALVGLGYEAIPILRKLYAVTQAFEARLRIVTALRKIRAKVKDEYLDKHPALAEKYNSEKYTDREIAVDMLLSDGSEVALMLLLPLVRDRSAMTVQDKAKSAAKDLSKKFIPLLNDVFVDEKEPQELRVYCLQLLGYAKDGTNFEMIKNIAFGSAKSDIQLRRTAIWVYAQLVGEAAYPALMEWFNETERPIKTAVLNALPACGKEKTVALVRQIIESKNCDLYVPVIWALRGAKAWKDLMPELKQIITDQDVPTEIREDMIRHTGVEMTPDSLPLFDHLLSQNRTDSITSIAGWWLQERPLVEAKDIYVKYLRHPEHTVRFNCAVAISRLIMTEVAPNVLEALKTEENSEVRSRLVRTLLMTVHWEAVPEIAKELKSEEPKYRHHAAWALYGLAGEEHWEIVEQLMPLLSEEFPRVRASALYAIERITGRHFSSGELDAGNNGENYKPDVQRWFESFKQYRQKVKNLAAVPDKERELAVWCAQNGLYREAKRHGEMVVSQFQDDEELKKALAQASDELKDFEKRFWDSPFLGVEFAQNSFFVYLDRVIERFAADKAGLKRYDSIVAIDGNKVCSIEEASGCIKTHMAGETVVFDIERLGKKMKIEVTLGADPWVPTFEWP